MTLNEHERSAAARGTGGTVVTPVIMRSKKHWRQSYNNTDVRGAGLEAWW